MSLMFPMVSTLDELFDARRPLDEAITAVGRGHGAAAAGLAARALAADGPHRVRELLAGITRPRAAPDRMR
ncbi:hypothetical protein [Pseudonocardia acidicola]|uniref:Uncharacterized protein n=1 Tax=Pseudonocardia acidicola TaxID=2724939 RepID=A0ABX1S8I3_9PSEU|nr:hypothetical protein [Pseudonocardia acidicola]NMH97868.1 hypothetical protein [Pseudonocardia acidicola]